MTSPDETAAREAEQAARRAAVELHGTLDGSLRFARDDIEKITALILAQRREAAEEIVTLMLEEAAAYEAGGDCHAAVVDCIDKIRQRGGRR